MKKANQKKENTIKEIHKKYDLKWGILFFISLLIIASTIFVQSIWVNVGAYNQDIQKVYTLDGIVNSNGEAIPFTSTEEMTEFMLGEDGQELIGVGNTYKWVGLDGKRYDSSNLAVSASMGMVDIEKIVLESSPSWNNGIASEYSVDSSYMKVYSNDSLNVIQELSDFYDFALVSEVEGYTTPLGWGYDNIISAREAMVYRGNNYTPSTIVESTLRTDNIKDIVWSWLDMHWLPSTWHQGSAPDPVEVIDGDTFIHYTSTEAIRYDYVSSIWINESTGIEDDFSKEINNMTMYISATQNIGGRRLLTNKASLSDGYESAVLNKEGFYPNDITVEDLTKADMSNDWTAFPDIAFIKSFENKEITINVDESEVNATSTWKSQTSGDLSFTSYSSANIFTDYGEITAGASVKIENLKYDESLGMDEYIYFSGETLDTARSHAIKYIKNNFLEEKLILVTDFVIGKTFDQYVDETIDEALIGYKPTTMNNEELIYENENTFLYDYQNSVSNHIDEKKLHSFNNNAITLVAGDIESIVEQIISLAIYLDTYGTIDLPT